MHYLSLCYIFSLSIKYDRVYTTNEWINSKLSSIITEFKLCDIYNADEFGLFFRLKPNKTFIANKNNFEGGKLSKERINILVCCNADGSDQRKLIINKTTLLSQ